MSDEAGSRDGCAAPPFARAAIIGVGLMGGSLALALRETGLARCIAGCSSDATGLQSALAQGLIDEATPDARAAAAGCDLIVLAVPVGAMQACFEAIAPAIAPGCLVIDVGSTKSDVIAAARAALGQRLPNFVPCHPIAGKEKAGAAAARASLYHGRKAILTPLPENPAALVARAEALWLAIGCRVDRMPAARHDAVFAAVSHLPHLLAFAYINGLLDQPDGPALMACGGPGFRDFSRIAASDPVMWRDVLLANQEAVLAQSQRFRQSLQALEDALRAGAGSELAGRLARASQARAQWELDAAAHADGPK